MIKADGLILDVELSKTQNAMLADGLSFMAISKWVRLRSDAPYARRCVAIPLDRRVDPPTV